MAWAIDIRPRRSAAFDWFFILLAAIAGLSALQPAAAKQMYQYQDASGAWVFADRPPADANTPVTVKPLPVSELPAKVSIRNRGTTDAPVLVAVNDYYGPIQVEITAERLRNMRTDPPLPARVVVPARSEVVAVTFHPTGPGWSYAYHARAVLGDPAAEHRPEQPYAPPFAPGQHFRITQAFDGAFSHQHPQSRYAVDISLPLGTPVWAARAGVVMEIADDFLDGGTDPKYQTRANAVRILHDDGTMAVYAHLHPDSVRVAPGARVARGTWLANSGNTGFSTGPHLHFAIQHNAGMELVAVPFEFADRDNHGFTPVEGMQLTAY
ncbi:MAG TPA: M23 family metallopeptidase [Candidatus Competibacteraceae bacterium]|nr:M23 family metallopeptidase [Candidatus Competibacteraceae bacterium]HQA24808.1 M23 family metallopeptidase [Candidatus Competibacteraceae bacterium]HQD55438.1 M23 family metallopeptidase [Candidatus Competibacteraceae bacterium]